MSLLRDSAWAGSAAIVLSGSRFVFTAIIARRLTVSDFGEYAYGQWLADFTFLIFSFGATGAISRYVAEYRHDPSLLGAFARRCRPFAVGLPWLAAVLVPVGAWLSGLSLEPSQLGMLALWTLTNGLWAMQTAALTGMQRFDLVFAANATAALILVLGSLLLPMGGEGLSRVFGLLSLASGCAVMFGYRATRQLALGSVPSVVDSSRWRAMRGYAVNVWLTALLWSLVWSRGEIPIVRAYLGDDGVAHYSAALSLFGGAIQAVMLATSGVASELTRCWGQGARPQAVALARKIMDGQLLVCGLAATVLINFSPELMQLAFGASYRGESANLAILSLGLLALAVSCQNHLLQIDTDARFSRDSTLGGLVILMGSALLLVATMSLPGAAFARAGTMLIMATIALVAANRRWGPTAFSRRNVASVFVPLAACAAVRVWAVDLGWPPRAALAMLSTACLVMGVRDVEGQQQVKTIVMRLRRALVPVAVRKENSP